jgi:hypothetical protein
MLPARVAARLLARLAPFASLLALVLTAGARSALAQPARALPVRLPDVPAVIRLDTLGRTLGVSASPARTWEALRAAHAEFKITPTTRDQTRGELGDVALAMRREFAGERVSRSLDCGRGLTGEYADQYRLTAAIFTWVQGVPSQPDSSTVHTAFVAGGRATDGTRAWPIQCNSLGRFEQRLAERVRALVADSAAGTPRRR